MRPEHAPLSLQLRAEAAAEDARDGADWPAECADYEAARCDDDYWKQQP
jgi:hypothetical protein